MVSRHIGKTSGEAIMKPRANASRRLVTAIALATVAILLPAVAFAGIAGNSAPARPAAATTVSTCNHLEVWLGLGNGGAGAGSVRYPIEFSNTGHRACRLRGFPRVVALNSHHSQLGKIASHFGTKRTVILQPGATAHALLVVSEILITPACGMVTARGLGVSLPGEGKGFSPIDGFSFSTCKKIRIMSVGAVRSHTGIPSFTAH
jgi:hypothetical protein